MINDNVKKYCEAVALENMSKGLEKMVKEAPDSEKKEMLLDILKLSKEVANSHKVSQSTIEYLLYQVTAVESLLDMEKLRVKELEIKLEKREEQIKEML